jgi:hypothetical protein
MQDRFRSALGEGRRARRKSRSSSYKVDVKSLKIAPRNLRSGSRARSGRRVRGSATPLIFTAAVPDQSVRVNRESPP